MNNSLGFLIAELIDTLSSSTSYEESWGDLTMRGTYSSSIFKHFNVIDQWLSDYGGSGLSKYFFDGDSTEIEDFDAYLEKADSFSEWKLTINKQGLLERKIYSEYYVNFFLTAASCKQWIDGVDTLETKNPLNAYSPLQVLLGEGGYNFGSAALLFTSYDSADLKAPTQGSKELPTFDKIQQYVHFISEKPISFDLNTYDLFISDYSSELAKSLTTQIAKNFAVCAINEYYSASKIVINGIRRINISLFSEPEKSDYDFIIKLRELISWLYVDRVETRLKLFNERLTLEATPSDTLIYALKKNITSALSQAKQRYNFVILDRKDAYLKELKDLLKDLRSQSDLYSIKARTLLGNFLRDTLATLVMIGFTIFTKFSDNIGLDKVKLLDYVFSGLAVFLMISMFFQLCVDVSDLWITSKELNYWKKASKELISDSEFEQHYTETLQPRKRSAYIIYGFISILYIGLAILCFNYPNTLNKMIKIAQPKNLRHTNLTESKTIK